MNQMTLQQKRVIIIGAGAAGLAAAQALSKHPEIHLTVIEARDRIGGRIDTRRNLLQGTPLSHIPFDFGASWIHGTDDANPLMALAKAGQLEYTHTDSDIVYSTPSTSDGGDHTGDAAPLATEISDHYWKIVWDIFDLAQEYATNHRDEIPEDLSFQDWLDQYLASRQSSDPTSTDDYMSEEDQAAVPWMALYWADENAIPLNSVSMKYMDSEDIFDGDHSIVSNGFDRVVKVLAKDLDRSTRCLLQHVVNRIEYNESHVKVSTDQGSFTADAVLVAVPLGVLKSPSSITFSPSLPTTKQQAISNLGFGTMLKIVLVFPHCFWPEDKHFLNFLPTPAVHNTTPNPALTSHLNPKQILALKTYMRDLANYSNLIPVYGKDAPILIGYATNTSAELLETLTDQEAKEVYMAQLAHYFPILAKEPEKYGPTKWFMTRWGSDPLTRGSYTSIPVGATPKDIEAFTIPVGARSYSELGGQHKDLDKEATTTVVAVDDSEGGRVFFAGEHTCPMSFASVHGAIISGRREAAKILGHSLHE